MPPPLEDMSEQIATRQANKRSNQPAAAQQDDEDDGEEIRLVPKK